MSEQNNLKSEAWDLVGGLFWKIGRKNAKPSDKMISKFLENITRENRVLVIGASTKFLVEKALEVSDHVMVIDFSKKMCADLQEEIHDARCNILLQDALLPPIRPELSKQNIIIAERLINRFSLEETHKFFENIKYYLAKDGVVRLTIKLGFYEIDKSLIAEGNRKGTLSSFYDEKLKVIDFSKAKEELQTSVVAHGDIPKDILIQWYEGRAKEARFDDVDIIHLVDKFGYQLTEHELIDTETHTFYYAFRLKD